MHVEIQLHQEWRESSHQREWERDGEWEWETRHRRRTGCFECFVSGSGLRLGLSSMWVWASLPICCQYEFTLVNARVGCNLKPRCWCSHWCIDVQSMPRFQGTKAVYFNLDFNFERQVFIKSLSYSSSQTRISPHTFFAISPSSPRYRTQRQREL